MTDIKQEEKMVFGVSPREDGYDVLLGLSAASWEYTKDGKTLHVDLNGIGIPVRIIVFGQPTQKDCYEQVKRHNNRHGNATVKLPAEVDMGIKDGAHMTKANLKNSTIIR